MKIIQNICNSSGRVHGQCIGKLQLSNTASYLWVYVQTKKTLRLQRLCTWAAWDSCERNVTAEIKVYYTLLPHTHILLHIYITIFLNIFYNVILFSTLFSTCCKDAFKDCVFSTQTLLKSTTNNSNEMWTLIFSDQTTNFIPSLIGAEVNFLYSPFWTF